MKMTIRGCLRPLSFPFATNKKLGQKIQKQKKLAEAQLRNNSYPSHPMFSSQSLSQKYSISKNLQLAPLLGCFSITTFCTFAENFSDLFFLGLGGFQKLGLLATLLHIHYPQNKLISGLVISGCLVSLAVPPTYLPGVLVQIYQLIILLWLQPASKGLQNINLSEEDKKILVERLRMKVILYFVAMTSILFKFAYYYYCLEMEKKLQQMNQENKKLSDSEKQS